jgi:hypothetical protein
MRRWDLSRLFVRILVNSAPLALAASGCVSGEDGGSTTEPCTPLQRIYSVGLSDPTLGPLLEACIVRLHRCMHSSSSPTSC